MRSVGDFGSKIERSGSAIEGPEIKALAEILFSQPGNDSGIPDCEMVNGEDLLLGRYDRRRSSKRGKGNQIRDSASRQRSSSTYN